MEAAAAGEGPLGFARQRAAAVGVAGDHLDVVDAEAGRHLGAGLDAAAEDRPGGDVGLEIGSQQPVEAADREREAGAGGAGAEGRLHLFVG